MAAARSTSTTPSGGTAPETSKEQRALIRNFFAAEFGGVYINAIEIKTSQLFKALTTKRIDDLGAEDDDDDDDDGSLHSEVLKNTTDLLQRFHLCAPAFPGLGGAAVVPENMKKNVQALFWSAVFCKYFCDDMEGFTAGKVWYDVRRFVVALGRIWENDLDGGREVPARARLIAAAMYEPRPAKKRSRRNALLWELMGMASVGLMEDSRLQNMEAWAAEATARVFLWKKLAKDDKVSVLRSPIIEDTRAYPKDVLPDYNEGECFQARCSTCAWS